jgi:hypothetical protein
MYLRGSTSSGSMFNASKFKIYGAILSLLAAATVAIGTANVVLTRQAYCDPWTGNEPTFCSNTQEPYIWTWVAPGIWASTPIFLAGLFAMCLSNDPSRWTRLFAVFIFLSCIIFSPAIIILSSIEVWRGHASTWNFYKLGNDLSEGNIMVEDSPYHTKFALPLVITILAGIMFIMTGLITFILCCCMQSIGVKLPQEPVAGSSIRQSIYQPTPSVIESKEVYCPPRAMNPITTHVDYQSSTGPFMATRYNSVLNPSNPGVMFGNFPSRAFTPRGPPSNNSYDGNSPNSTYRYQ